MLYVFLIYDIIACEGAFQRALSIFLYFVVYLFMRFVF